jgi:predicted DNA binding CopG/RHH family protein
MLTLKEWMELVDYRITEGGDYNLYSDNAYALSSWNGDQDGYSMEIIFDTKTQVVYCVEACDYKHQRAYRLFHPDYKNVDQIKEAWDDVDWCDLEADDDFIQKSLSIVAGEDYDTRVSIPIDLPDHELMAIFKMAHEADMTFNDYVEKILREKLADAGFVAGMKAAHEARK